MKKVVWSISGSLALAIALVVGMGVAAPPLTAESGARVCGYLVQPLLPGAPAQDSSVVQNVALMVEVPEGDSSMCNHAMDEIEKEITSNPQLAPLKQYYNGDVNITNTKAYNRWVYFKKATCETIGGYFGGKVGNNDICEGGHPKNGMNRLSTSDSTYHTYTWTLQFKDTTTGKPLSASVLTKVTTSTKRSW